MFDDAEYHFADFFANVRFFVVVLHVLCDQIHSESCLYGRASVQRNGAVRVVIEIRLVNGAGRDHTHEFSATTLA